MTKFKKSFSKLLAILLVMAITMPIGSANATSTLKSNLTISVEKFLSSINVSITDVSLGNKIPTYVIENDVVVNSQINYYPLINNNGIVGLLGVFNEESATPNITFTTAYNGSLNDFIKSNKKVALLGKGKSFMAISGGSSVALVGQKFSYIRGDNVQFSSVNKSQDLSITKTSTANNQLAVASSYGNGLAVPVKIQQNSLICWAAATASVGQYKTGINKTSLDVANYCGNLGGGTVVNCADALSGMYRLSSTPSPSGVYYFNYLKAQIDSNKPVIGGFLSSASGHAVVLNGYNSSSYSASFTYMDPWDGKFYTSNIVTDGTFTFISNGYSFTLVNYLQLN